MIYFIYKDAYCSAEEINEQLAKKVTQITKEEYDEYITQLDLQQGLDQISNKED